MVKVACEEGFEPPTHSLEGCCSIQLSYSQRQILLYCRYLIESIAFSSFGGGGLCRAGQLLLQKVHLEIQLEVRAIEILHGAFDHFAVGRLLQPWNPPNPNALIPCLARLAFSVDGCAPIDASQFVSLFQVSTFLCVQRMRGR